MTFTTAILRFVAVMRCHQEFPSCSVFSSCILQTPPSPSHCRPHTHPTLLQVELPSAKNHETGRTCEKCRGALFDNIVHFGEALPWHALTMANAKFLGADLSIAIGTSLQVEPAASLPFKSKRRKKNPPRPRAVIINLQPTRLDGEADLVIRARSDDVLGRICKAFKL